MIGFDGHGAEAGRRSSLAAKPVSNGSRLYPLNSGGLVGMAQCWYLYLLVCRDGRTYSGIAIDVAARFAAHSRGKGAKFTRSNPPVRVLGARPFATKSDALKAEAALKKLSRTEKLAWARNSADSSMSVDAENVARQGAFQRGGAVDG